MSQRVIYNIVNKNKNYLLASKVRVARGFLARLLGLMFRKSMNLGEALIFYHTTSIHTFFMRFPLDIVFLDKDMKVIKIYNNLKPSRVIFCPKAFMVIELASKLGARCPLEIGDNLELTAT